MATETNSDRDMRPGEIPDDTRLNVADAAQYLGVSDKTLRNLQASGRIRHFKVGRLVQFSLADLRAYVASCERPAVNP